ncbi:GntR family transcriptional regulator (plasmid) [Rhizobium lusitanum]|uniref:GntR family transcriptional regulator n=1 Tax=Rhizobium lusitanum TaxID=293958 RepID=UPI00161F2BAA|nr:GntR family transcriptional regulator [Rhizobium lusitanum]QND44610.1 GntR family transcriptional regulator [Rhizobium lusitanum]
MSEVRSRGRPKYSGDDKSAVIFRKLAEANLDRSDASPLWVQLKNRIQDAIISGLLPPQSQIPPEQTLCEIFEASKPVIRAAFGALAAEGHIVKMPRKGMFVAGGKQETDFITANLGVFGDLTARGHTVTVKTFEFVRVAPSESEQRIFKIPENGSVIRIGRVYFSDGKPLTLTHISLPAHKVPGMEKLDIEDRSIFQTLKEHYGLTVKNAERWFTAELPPEDVVLEMGIEPNHPLIAIESIAYDHDGNALEYYQAYYDSSVARIHVKIGS